MYGPFPNLPPFERGVVSLQRHASRALRDNPWGDPSDRDLWVYLPPGYEHSAARYPAVMILAGFAGTGERFLARGLHEPSLPSVIDHLISEGCPPFIAVFPDAMSCLGGSQYVDSPAVGDYATYIAKELRAFVDGRYRTSGAWGVAGHSSGGFGALHLAMNFPGAFQAVASHAGDIGFDLCYLADIPRAVAGVQAAGGLTAFLESFWGRPDPGPDAFAAFNLLAMSAAYAPDLEAADFPARLPVNLETGEVDFDAFRAWSRFDPLVQVEDPARAEALRGLRLLWIDAGDRDEHGLHLGAARLTAKLAAKGIDHVWQRFPGGHRGLTRRYPVSLPRMVEALSQAEASTPG